MSLPRRPSHDPTDAELVARVNAGDSDAFTQLYERHRDWCISVAWRFVRNADRAADITQETFLHWLRRFPPHAPPFELTAQVRTYLYTVIRSIALTQRRRDATAHAHLPPLAASRTEPSESSPIETGAALRVVLDRLSEFHREVLILRYVDDLALDEIALALNLPLGTVKSRLHHALQALRDDPTARELFFKDL